MKLIHRWVRQFSRNFTKLIFLLLLPVIAYAQAANITSMRIKPSSNNSQFVFTLSKKVPVKVTYHTKPHRLKVVFSNTKRRFSLKNTRLGGSNVKSITSANQGRQKVVFTLKTSMKPTWKTAFIKSKKSKSVDFKLTVMTPKVKKKPKTAYISTDNIRHDLLRSIMSASKKIMKKTKVDRKLVIVIDAGHGGKDTGAIGKKGVREKNVVLAIAKKLEKNINRSKRMHAVMTRSGDYYVPLRTRLHIARKHHADLFISIHADAFLNGRVSGASIYALSPKGATSEAARWLAQQENHSELGGVALDSLSDQSDTLRSIMIDLAQTATIKDSLQLGRRVMDSIDDFSKMHRKRVEQAPFVVLKSPDIPSVLVETGFITNPREERRLNTRAYQQKLADAIYKGINTYFQSRYYLTMSHAQARKKAAA